MNETQERNRACRIAYGHARGGRPATARQWIEIAYGFAAPTPRQLDHFEALLRAGLGPIPGQLNIEGKEAVQQEKPDCGCAHGCEWGPAGHPHCRL